MLKVIWLTSPSVNSTTPKTLTFGDLVSHVESGLDVIQVPEAGLLRRYEKVYARLAPDAAAAAAVATARLEYVQNI